MTETARARTGARYRGVVYGFHLLDPDTRRIRLDYVGQTRQKGRARENQHRDDKPWEDLIVGSPVVLAEGMWTDAELDAAELGFIRRLRPRMNYTGNLDNPRRVEIWRQKQLRWARDDAAGRPRWVPLEQRQPAGLLDQPVVARPAPVSPVRRVSVPRTGDCASRLAHRWPPAPWQTKLGLWAFTWAATAAVMWGVSARLALFSTWRANALCGCLISAGLLVWSLCGAPVTRRQWRRRRRKRRR